MESAAGKSCKDKPWAFSECDSVESVELESILTQVRVRGFWAGKPDSEMAVFQHIR